MYVATERCFYDFIVLFHMWEKNQAVQKCVKPCASSMALSTHDLRASFGVNLGEV